MISRFVHASSTSHNAFRPLSTRIVTSTRGMSAQGPSRAAPFVPMVEYESAQPAVKAIFDDIIQSRKLPGPQGLNNFWKTIAADEKLLRRTWTDLKEIMGPGTLPPLFKEMIYLAVSQTNGCEYCMLSHGAAARKQGMTKEMYMELTSIVAMANETNKLATALRVPPDDAMFGNIPFAESESK